MYQGRKLFILSVFIFLAFIPSFSFAQNFTATTLGDYGNITVMEVAGNYDANNPDGTLNEIPRQEIAKEFFRLHNDDYDFLVIYSNFDFQMPEADAKAFYLGVRNDIQGIGKVIFDSSSRYGSSGKLQGTIDMGNVSGLVTDPLKPGFEDTLSLLAHEQMHRWGAYVKFRDTDGNISTALLGKDSSHWSYLLDTDASVLYGNDWQDNGDGTFTSIDKWKYYSPLDLYLMGFIDKSEVPPMLLISNPGIDPAQMPEVGVTLEGIPQHVSIDDIIAAEGERVPASAVAQKRFRTAFILITAPSTFTGYEVYEIENLRNEWVTRFSVLTDGEGIMQVDSTLKGDLPVNPGITPLPPDPRTLPSDINDGVTWLMNNQRIDGSWMDLSHTTERDTAETVLTLKNFDVALQNYSAGLLWLNTSHSGNMDYLSRKIEAVVSSGGDVTALLDELLSRQNRDGGWGSNRGYMSNPLDTSFALRSLTTAGYSGQSAISDAIEYLKSRQDTDGGWGSDDRVSTIQATSNVLTAFNGYRGGYQLEVPVNAGISWLLSRQNIDGGFGNSPSTVYDSAIAVLTLRQFYVSTEITNSALDYIKNLQSEDGSWYMSAYQTALAVNAIQKATVDPDLSINAGDITFIPSSVTALPSNVVVNADIWNIGKTGVTQAKVALYDGAVSADRKVGEQVLAFPGQSSTAVTFSVTIADGDEHLFYITVDPEGLVKESRETNNTAYKRLSPVPTYDFEILPSDISLSSGTVNISEDVIISATIRNRGTVNAYNVQLKYYIDDPAGSYDIASVTVDIPAGSAISKEITWKTDRIGDSLPITVHADPANSFAEISETNNQAAAYLNIVSQGPPYDFEILPSDISLSSGTVNISEDVKISATIRNRGTVNAYNVQLKYYIDDPAGSYDIASVTVDIPAGSAISKEITWKTDRVGDSLPITVHADPADSFTEISETNNQAAAYLTVKNTTAPNLTVSYQDIAITPSPAKEGGNTNISVIVRNEGFSAVSDAKVHFYNGVPGAGGTLIGEQVISSLNAGKSALVSLDWINIMDYGERIIYIQADPENLITEIKEDDNDAFTMLDIISFSDLVISTNSISFNPALPKGGDIVSIMAVIQNKGGQEAQNVLVKALEGDTLIGSQTFPLIPGNSQVSASFTYDTTGKNGVHKITVIVDPDNTVLEQREDNNQAEMSISVQDANLWITEKYISPNGDGVKDSTQLFFRLDTMQTLKIIFVNGEGTTVRTFSGGQLENTSGGNITWDGLDDNGMVVDDGQYQIQLFGVDSNILGMLTVIVDNNRSSLTDAVGTEYLLKKNLTCRIPTRIEKWRWLPDESGIIFSIIQDGHYRNIDPNYVPGIYRMNPDGEDIVRLYPLDPSDTTKPDPYGRSYSHEFDFEISPDGEKIAFKHQRKLTNYYDAGRSYLWVMDRDGKNQTLLEGSLPNSMVRSFQWSPDGEYIAYTTTDRYIRTKDILIIRPDGTGKTIIDPALDISQYYLPTYYPTYYLAWSPDSRKIAYSFGSGWYQNQNFRITDMSGNKEDINTVNAVGYVKWLDNEKISLLDGSNLWLIDASGSGNHIKLSDSTYFPIARNESMPVSPDGESLAFFSYLYPAIHLNISDINGNTSILNETRYTDVGRILWSPSGDRIAFIEHLRSPDISLALIDVKTGGKRSFGLPFTSSSDLYVWLSDGASIIAYDQGNLYAINPETGELLSLDSWIREGAEIKRSIMESPVGRYITYEREVDTSFACDYAYDRNSPPDYYIKDLWTMSSLLNITADLRASRDRSAVILQGTATDLNFEGYMLEYADTKNPDAWNLISLPSNKPVLDGIFTTWVPPYEGTFYVKLTVWDKAGNVAVERKMVSWGLLSSITNLYKNSEIFSPNGDGVKDTVELHYRVLDPVHLEFYIYDDDGALITTMQKDYTLPVDDYITWDGRDSSGRTVPDGIYKIRIFTYEFFFEVDNTPPALNLKLSAISEIPETYELYAELAGYAVDRNLQGWFIEYGEGENSQEWSELMGGEGQLAAKDENGDLLTEPAEDALIEEYAGVEVGWLGEKRLRITSEDFAGNRSSYISNMIEEKIIFNRWDEDISFRKTGQILDVLGEHTIEVVETIKEPITGIYLQYRKSSEENALWQEELIALNPESYNVGMIWDSSKLDPESAYSVRIKAVDIHGNKYYSYTFVFGHAFEMTVKVNCTIQVPTEVEVINAVEDLALLRFQIMSEEDPRFTTWTDFRVYDTAEGDIIPTGIFTEQLPELQKAAYNIKMSGTGISGRSYAAEVLISSAATDYCSPSGLSIKLAVEQVDASACGLTSDNARLTASFLIRKISTGIALKSLTYYIQSSPETWDTLKGFDLSKGTAGSVMIDTSNLAEGNYPVKAVLVYQYNDSITEISDSGTLVVDRLLPAAQIIYPAKSSMLCPIKVTNAKGDWYGINVEGIATDNTGVKSYKLYYGIGENPDLWLKATTKKYDDKVKKFVNVPIEGKGPIQGQIGIWDVSGLKGTTFTLKLEVVDTAGNKSCYTTSFTVDNFTDITNLVADNSLFSPNNDGDIDDVNISFEINEYATVDVKAFKLIKDDKGKYVPDTTPVRTFVSGLQHLTGAETITWDGKDDAGYVVPDGLYSITVFAIDSCGNTALKSIEVEVLNNVDTTSPYVMLFSPQDGEYFGSSKNIINISGKIVEGNLDAYSLRYGAGDDPSHWTQLKGGRVSPLDTHLYDWDAGKGKGVPDGLYTISLYARDMGGLEGEARVKIFVDNTPPVVQITFPEEGKYVKANIDIKGTASDPNMDKYSLDFSAGNCSEAFKWAVIKTSAISNDNGTLASWATLPPDGDYCLRLSAIDKLGNAAETKVNIKVDTHPPAAPVLAGKAENKTNAALNWTQNAESDLAGYNLYKNNQKINTGLINVNNYVDQNLGEGVYLYTVKAVDLAGWESGHSNEIQVKVDLTGPDARISLPQDGSRVSGLIDIKGTAYSDNDFKEYTVYAGRGSAPSVWDIIRRSPVPTPYGTLTQWDTGTLEKGYYSIKLETADISGNINTSQITVTIDNTPPAAPVLVSVIPGSSDITVRWQANTEPDLAGYLLYRNGQLVNVPGTVVGDLKPYLITGTLYLDRALPDGKFRYYLVAMYQAGNMSVQSNIIEADIDTHPPKAYIVEPLSGSRFEKKTLVKAESADIDIASIQFEYKKTGDALWIRLGSAVATQPFITYLDPISLGFVYGDYHLRAIATDTGGRTDLSPSYIIVTHTDVTSPSAPADLIAVVNGQDVKLTWTDNTESDLSGYNIYRTGENIWTKINSVLVNDITYTDRGLSDGMYTYEITAVDTYANESKPSRSTAARVYAPVIEQPYTPTQESAIQISGNNTEPGSKVEIFSDTDLGPGYQGTVISDAGGDFKFSLNLLPGENRITAKATDNNGNISRASDMVVVIYNEPPSAPTGLVSNVENYDVTLVWNPNPEADVSGYNVYRDGEKLNEPVDITSGTASASHTYPYYYYPLNAFDSSPYSYWQAIEPPPVWWQIDLPSPELINHIKINWYNQLNAAKDYEIQFWSGYAWITHSKVTGNNTQYNLFDFDQPYRTDKIRIYITALNNTSNYITISDIEIRGDSLIVDTSFKDLGLSEGEYSYAVTAVDYYGLESQPSVESITSVGDVTSPSAPQDLTATASSPDIILNWSANTEADLAGYSIYRSSGQGWLKINLSLITDTTYTDAGLPNGAYTYRITAEDTKGHESLPSHEASATVFMTPPQITVNLSVSSVPEGGALNASWQYAGTVAGFNLYRSTISGGQYTKVNNSLISGISYLDTGLTNGITYYYVVVAEDSMGNESLNSNEAAGIPSDSIPPQRPEVFFPTVPGTPVVLFRDKTDISGRAEPGSYVEVFLNGVSKGIVRTPEEYKLNSRIAFDFNNSGVNLSPDGHKVAFIDISTGNIMIYDLRSGAITDSGCQGYQLQWSPDGNKILFTMSSRIMICDTVEGSLSSLTGYVYDEDGGVWSPDGDQVAFHTNSSGNYEVWIKDLISGELRQITNTGDALYPQWSSDKKHIAYIDSYCNTYAINLETGETINIDSESCDYKWSPNGNRLLYQAGGGAIRIMDIETLQKTEITTGSYYPLWSPDGENILYIYWDSAFSRYALEVRNLASTNLFNIIPEGTDFPRFTQWSRSGQIAFTQVGFLNLVDSRGQFRLSNVQIEPGGNLFYAQATDQSGNISTPSEEIMVNFDASMLPELEITEGDISIYPHFPIDGQEAVIDVLVRNSGQVDVEDVDIDIYLWDSSGNLKLIKSDNVHFMLTGADHLVSFKWDSTGKLGKNTFIVVVDPENKITEEFEINNYAAREFYVVEEEGISMTTTLDSVQYYTNQDVNIDIDIINSGFERDAVLEIWVEDENGYPVILLDTINMHLAYGSMEHFSLLWNAGATYAGSYRVHTVLKNVPEVIAENIAPFILLPDINLDISVATDKVTYGSKEDVNISFGVSNNGTNYIIPEVTARLRITDVNGNVDLTEDKTIINLLPEETVVLTSVWNTGLNLPGDYTVVVEILVDGQLISSKSAPFSINSSVIITGNIKATPSVVFLGNKYMVDYTVSNNGNIDVSRLVLKVLVIDPVTQAVMDTNEDVIDLMLNSDKTGQFIFSTQGYGLKSYSIGLQSVYQGNTMNIASASLSVKDGAPPVVTVVSPVPDSYYNSAVNLTVIATDNASGVDSVEYRADNGAWRFLPVSDLSSGRYSATWTPAVSDEGVHEINFRATDKAGNVSLSASTMVMVDFTSPVLTVSGVAHGKYYNIDVTPVVTVTDKNPATVVTKLNNADFVSGTTITAEGQYTLSTNATDKAGNISTVIVGFTIDKTPPSPPVIISPPDGSLVSTDTIDITGQAEPGLIIEMGFVNIFQTKADPVTGEFIFTGVTLIPGNNIFSFTTIDVAGNISKPTDYTLTLSAIELKLSKVLHEEIRTLVWVNEECDDEGDECTRLDLLKYILKQTVNDYYLVYDQKDFQKQLRNPYYTDLMILGSHPPIEANFMEELREQVYSGKGLISSLWAEDGEHHVEGENKKSSVGKNNYDSLFGIRFKGHFSGDSHVVELLKSPVSGSGMLNVTGKAVKIEAADDTVTAGWIKESEYPEEISNGTVRAEGLYLRSQGEEEDGESEENDKEYPAIVLNEYGNGKTIYYAFDIGQALNDLNYTQISEMIKNSISYVHNSVSVDVIYPNQMVPVEIKIENLGEASDLRVLETYPHELKLYDPITGQWITNNPWIVDMHLKSQETKTMLYYTLTPDIAETYILHTEVGYLDKAGAYNFYKEINLDINIDKNTYEMAGEIISALSALSVSGKDKNKIKNAIKYIKNVQDRAIVYKEDVEKNIGDIRKAIDSLLSIESTDVSGVRLMMDELLKAWESRYYFEIF